MQEVKISMELLGKLTNVPTEELKTTLESLGNEEGQVSTQEIDNIVSDLIGKKFKEIGKNQLGRGAREALLKKEKELAEKYGVQKTGDILALVDSIVSTVPKSAEKPTQEEIMNDPIVIEKLKALSKKLQEAEGKARAIESEYQKKQVENTVQQKAWEIITSKNPDLPKDQNVRNNLIAYFKKEVSKGNFAIENGSIKVLDENGNVKHNDLYEPLSFEDFVLSKSIFEFKKDPVKKTPIDSVLGGNLDYGIDIANKRQVFNKHAQLMREGKAAEAHALKESYLKSIKNA